MTNETENWDKQDEFGVTSLDACINSWLSQDKNGDDYMNEDDIVNLRKHLKSFISSHLTELLQGLILDLEGEKQDKKVDFEELDEIQQARVVAYDVALNLAQERIRKLIK